MRILVLTNLYPNVYEPNRSTFNRQQIRELAARHAVRVISPISWVEELGHRKRQGRLLGPERRWECDGIPVEHPRYLYPPRMLRGWYGHFYRFSVRDAFERAVSEFRPDVVFAPWAFPDGWAAVKLGREVGIPVVLKLHGCDLLCGGQGLDPYPARKRRTIEALRGAAGIVAVSRHLADRAIELGADRASTRVVYDGIDSTLFRPGPRGEARRRLGIGGEAPLVLFIGNLVEVKAPSALVGACAQSARGGVPFTCVMIGEGPLRGELERQIRSLGLDERVRLPGARPHRELGDWYRAANVFVLPSLSEGVPCVLLEASACGTPWVASAVGGIPEIAHLGASRLVRPGDSAALAGGIESQLDVCTAPSERPRFARSHADAASEVASVLAMAVRRSRAVAESVPDKGAVPEGWASS